MKHNSKLGLAESGFGEVMSSCIYTFSLSMCYMW